MSIELVNWKISKSDPTVILTDLNDSFIIPQNQGISAEFIIQVYQNSINFMQKQYLDRIKVLEQENLELKNKTINIKTNLKSAHATLDRLLTNY
jgi:hypothetical protein